MTREEAAKVLDKFWRANWYSLNGYVARAIKAATKHLEHPTDTTPNAELSKLVDEWSKETSRHIGIDLWNDGYAHARNFCARELQCLVEKSITPTKTNRRLDDDLW